MASDDFQDAALVLVGHGSTLNADSSAPTYQHGDELRRRKLFGQVIECFWKLEPNICAVLRGVYAPRAFIVPVFISEGYFTEEVIPRELGFCQNGQTDFARVQRRGGQTLHYCGPVGTHDSMTEVIVRRAREVVEKFPFPRAPKPKETSLFIAGHGTGNNENSRKAVEAQVELIRAMGHLRGGASGVFGGGTGAWRIGVPDGCRRVKQHCDGCHFSSATGCTSMEDIPMMLGEAERVVRERLKSGQPTWRNPTEKNGKLVWYSKSIGSEPHIADVILERVRDAAGLPVAG